jgi:4-carboxymuconolactone decarboxylase
VTLPADVDPRSLSRLPLVERATLDAEGQRLYDLVTSPEGRTIVGLQGPGGIWLHSPKLAARVRATSQYLRYETALGRRLTELAILVTARELDHQFEWTAHEPVALKEGLEAAIIDVVKHRKPVAGLPPTEALIVEVGRQLFRDRSIRADTFARAVEAFGRGGLVELVTLMGNYAMTAVLLNAFDQQLRPGQPPLLPIP